MPLSRRAQRSARVVALGAAAPGLGPRTASRTSPPAPAPLATAPAAPDGADDAAIALRTTTNLAAAAVGTIDTAAIDAAAVNTTGLVNAAAAVGRLTIKGARPAGPERIAAAPSPAVPCP